VRDHHELLSMGNRIESGNAAINLELAQQGNTIAQVLRGIHVRPPPPIERTHTQVLTCVLHIASLMCHVFFFGGTARISTLVFRMRPSTGKRLRSQYR
jgi:hypothetical protein